MQDEAKINRILAELDAIRLEVKSLLPARRPETKPVAVSMPKPAITPTPNPLLKPQASESTAMDRFWEKVEDWLCVRGEFAPTGMSREFAVATRWLTRVGAVLLVGAIAYFLMLAIDKGWIGPAQRVYGMMAWGVAGTVFGTWLKLKSEKYAILGEVCAAVGLVAVYLSFGLGHRFFKPPVIASGYVAFAGLFVATTAAGVLSVRLKSLMIACLALAGGFLVPTICSFGSHDVQLHAYLLILSLGACAVAYFRGWTPYAFAAIAVSALFSNAKCSPYVDCDGLMSYLFHSLEFALFVAMTIRGVADSDKTGRALCWIATTIAAIFFLCTTEAIVNKHCDWNGALAIHNLVCATVFAVLAVASRRRDWGGTSVLLVFSCICAMFALGTACADWRVDGATAMFLFCVFAALLAELGVRSREKTLQVFSLICTVLLSLVALAAFEFTSSTSVHGYARGLVDRIQYLWPVPALVAFVGWRLGAPGSWLEKLRVPTLATASGMAFLVLTAESHFFGSEFLPSLRGGFVTIVWAVAASALLAAGIVRRLRVARLSGLGILVGAVVKLLLFDTASLATPGRVGVFAAVGVLLIVGAFLYLRFRSVFKE